MKRLTVSDHPARFSCSSVETAIQKRHTSRNKNHTITHDAATHVVHLALGVAQNVEQRVAPKFFN